MRLYQIIEANGQAKSCGNCGHKLFKKGHSFKKQYTNEAKTAYNWQRKEVETCELCGHKREYNHQEGTATIVS